MNIEIREYHGSGNWIVAAETKPLLEDDGSLVLREAAWKTKRGRAEITSIIVHNDDRLAVVLVGYRYNGKYRGGGQYWQYYRCSDANVWKRVMWKQLHDADRMTVLDNYVLDHVPGWANVPGKLVRDYVKAGELRTLEQDEQGTCYGYKYLVYVDGLYRSTAAGGSAPWHNDELEADEEPSENNRNGIYAMKSRKSTALLIYRGLDRRLVKLALSGTVIEANEGLRAQHAQIVEVLS